MAIDRTPPPLESGKPRNYVAVDVGQTGMRAHAVVGDRVGNAATGARVVPFPTRAAADVVAARIADVAHSALSPDDGFDLCVVGLSGYVPGAECNVYLASAIARETKAGRAIVVSDSVTGYVGALGKQAGVSLIWGTGAVALAADGISAWSRVDGRGPLLGDHGSGFWIGQQGLRSAISHIDGRGGSSVLAERALLVWESADQWQTELCASESPTSVIAQFAPHVIAAADEDDPVALEIIEHAARAVAKTVVAAASRYFSPLDPVPVACLGGIIKGGLVVTKPLLRHLARALPNVTLELAEDAHIQGVNRIALDTSPLGMFPGLVVEAGKQELL